MPREGSHHAIEVSTSRCMCIGEADVRKLRFTAATIDSHLYSK